MPQKLRLSDYIYAFPLVLLATLRGDDVGTDTGNYVAVAQNVILWKGQGLFEVEYGYVLLVRLIAAFTNDPRLVVAAISLLAAILFFIMLNMWESGQCIVSLMLISLYFFSFTMNGLRIGIAYPIAAISILQLEKRHYVKFIILAIASVSVQMTAALLLPMLLLARLGAKVSLKKLLYGLFAGSFILYLAYYFFSERVLYKILIYSMVSAPTSNSGFGPLLTSFVCGIIAIWFSEKRHRYLGLIFFLIQVVFYIITQLSYAGLRFQIMALFAQLLALSYYAKRPINKGRLVIVFLLCILTFTETARNLIATAGEPDAFIPYHFVWESQ